MKTLKEFINESKIQKKEFEKAVEEFNAICDYYHEPSRMFNKISTLDNKRKEKMKTIINNYLQQEGIDKQEFWDSNKWNTFS
jgi:hypothetical protein